MDKQLEQRTAEVEKLKGFAPVYQVTVGVAATAAGEEEYNVNSTTYHAKLVEEGPCGVGRGKYRFLGRTGIIGKFRVITGILAGGEHRQRSSHTQEATYHTRF